MYVEVRIAGVTDRLAWWEKVMERLRWHKQPLFERWEAWDAGRGEWRRYWRHDGSYPRWSNSG